MSYDCSRSFCQDGRARKADNRDEEEEEEGEGESKSVEGKRSRVRKKKNRRSVGKRNYRLMRRSFRHVGFERESAIGRCFFAKVIRVFARSISLFSSPFYFPSSSLHSVSLAPTLSSSLGEAPRASMIYPPFDVYWKARGCCYLQRSRRDKITVNPNNAVMELEADLGFFVHLSQKSPKKSLYHSRFNYESNSGIERQY